MASTKKTTVLQAPYSENGDLLHYHRSAWGSDEWRLNVPFRAVLTLRSGVTSGYSAKYVNWNDPEGHNYPMFVSDLVTLVRDGAVSQGKVDACWMVAKRGQNYGIRLAKPEEISEMENPDDN